jgi:hypothetical protein
MRVEHVTIQYVDPNAAVLSSTADSHDDVRAAEGEASLATLQFSA